ncbi:hypothetical protein L3Q82_003896 [Scortum barcoo]|uniref:Uncharacterized protein n=1 Tax=Scortum barcoo TaxID=214431 RepID=A0ACB8X625_9TELE|nr:hypothetical protein L3Q82_003896 [Scortum barcoo]
MAILKDQSYMSVNSSSSLPLPPLCPILPVVPVCIMTPPSSFIYTSFFITNILLLLPLSILILYLGLKQWRRQSSASTAAMSHSDIFTYHLVAVEMIGVFGFILCCCGIIGENLWILWVGLFFWTLIWFGETFFHVLTCVERYLAVVHPITYLSLRGERGIRVRNISIGCVWLLSIGGGCLTISVNAYLIVFLCLLVSSLVVISFCSLSVLCVLIRPGPGEQGGDRKNVDKSKLRAFYTIMAILGMLLMRFGTNLLWIGLNALTESPVFCVVFSCGTWLNLPSSLVLPLLFLHRTGTFACCKTK